LTEESREPGSVAGAAAEENSQVPAVGEPVVAEPAPLVPGARKPDAAEAEDAGVAEDERAGAGEAEQEELERLRAQVRELREQSRGDGPGHGEGAAPRKARRGRWRAPVSAVAITLGCVLAPVSVLGVWAANQVSNTDRYVANMAPLIDQPPIQHALSARITSEITSRIDVPALTASASAELARANLPRLSSLLTNFEAPIANGVDSLVATTVSRAVASPAMATLWVTANRAAHQGIVRVLSGQGGGSVSVVNNQVVLNLAPLITQVKENLTARGLGFAARIPTVNATFPLFEAPNLAKAQQGYRLITTLRWVLPFLALALLAAGIWVARRHRRDLVGAPGAHFDQCPALGRTHHPGRRRSDGAVVVEDRQRQRLEDHGLGESAANRQHRRARKVQLALCVSVDVAAEPVIGQVARGVRIEEVLKRGQRVIVEPELRQRFHEPGRTRDDSVAAALR